MWRNEGCFVFKMKKEMNAPQIGTTEANSKAAERQFRLHSPESAEGGQVAALMKARSSLVVLLGQNMGQILHGLPATACLCETIPYIVDKI